ncbi:MAG: DUF6939 family protein [Cuspidothrix sp.]
MSLIIKSRHLPPESLQKRYGYAVIIDVTSRAPEPWVRFSPFYPHGRIPVPFSPGEFSMSVEGIWQGLKVFETTDIDPSKLLISDMKSIKRSERKYGKVLGHRNGLTGDKLLSYREARRQIYLPSYLWVMENCLQNLIGNLKEILVNKTVVLLDYETNCEIENLSRPLSHAGLIKLYIEDNWPC